MRRRAVIIVLDGVGIGAAPDAAAYGDVGSDTLGNLARAVGGLHLPNLARAGLGNIAPLAGVRPIATPQGAWGIDASRRRPGRTARPATGRSPACISRGPFPTYPHGFPADVVDEFARATGRGVIGNVVGERHRDHRRSSARSTSARASWIVYTSADSVFQVAAHEEVVPLDELYRGVRDRARACSSRRTTCRA